jgi:hypothetical protein
MSLGRVLLLVRRNRWESPGQERKALAKQDRHHRDIPFRR